MANASQIFKDDEEETRNSHVSDDELRHIAGIGADEEVAIDETGGGFYSGDESPKSSSPGELGDAESSAESGATSTADGSFTGGEDTVGKGFTGKGQKKKAGVRASLKKHRMMIFLFGTPVSGVIVAAVLLILMASALKIPNLAQHIVAYQFSRITRQYADAAKRVTGEELGIRATETGAKNSAYDQLKAKYSTAKGRVSDTWSKLDKYRPEKVIKNMGADNGLRLEFTGDRFTGAVLNGEKIPLSQLGKSRFVPGLKNLLKFKDTLQFSRDFAPALEQSMRASDVGPIVRGIVANRLRKQLGIGLIAWTVGKYQGKNPKGAQIQEIREQANKISGNEEPVHGGVGPINDTADEAKAAGDKALTTEAGTQDIIKNNGVSSAVKDAIGKVAGKMKIQEAVSFASPAAAAVPLCIVYDGSMLPSNAPLIDQSAKNQQAAFYFVASGGDQQKNGSASSSDSQGDGLATAIGATNDTLYDISNSNPEIRAGGGTVDTSESTTPAEASPTGEFTLFDALGLPSSVSGIMKHLASSVCPAATNVWVQGTLGVLSVVASFIPGAGQAEAAVANAAKETTEIVVKKEATTLVDKIIGKIIAAATKKDATKIAESTATKRVVMKKIVLDGVKSTAKIVGITILAKLLVAARAGQLNSGTAMGDDLANMADAGGNIQAGELERTQLFGRPMLEQEVCKSNQADVAFMNQQESQKGSFDRYLSPSNANSLLSRTAIALNTGFGGSLTSTVARVGNYLLKPFSLVGSLGSMFTGKAFAAQNCPADSTDYGNVQFGWSEDESNLINSSNSYLPLENQEVLDNQPPKDSSFPNVESEIASKYANCFGYTYDASGDGSLDPTDPNSNMKPANGPEEPGSLGELLVNGDIVRDEHANVLNDGLCAPKNLGPENGEFGPQMVFRWRLAMEYDTTLDQLTNDQNVGTPDAGQDAGTGTGTGGTVATLGSYKNPLRDLKNITPWRIDGGVDYNADPGPIYAVGDAKITGIRTGGSSGWPGVPGAYILYQLTDGPAKGKYVYMAEDCTPTVSVGQTVNADTKICNYKYQGTGMEMGWGDGQWGYLTNDYNSHGGGNYASNSGQDFSKFLVSVGAPAGVVEGTKSTTPMPAGWPSWQ